jgi:hypothetical protein
MTESFLDDLGMCIGDEEVGSMAVPKIMQADLGKTACTDKSCERVGEHARRPWATVLAKTDVGLLRLPDAKGE